MVPAAVAINAAKGREDQYKLADSGGLYLHVLPSSQRYRRLNYRHQGKCKTLAFGTWPDVDLANARARRDVARKLLARGCGRPTRFFGSGTNRRAAACAPVNVNFPSRKYRVPIIA